MASRQTQLWTLVTLCVLASFACGKEFCERKEELECGDGNCVCYEGNDGELKKSAYCYLSVESECYHGRCSEENGDCVCYGCWEGTHCNISVNAFGPVFPNKEILIDVPKSYGPGVIGKLVAEDKDQDRCLNAPAQEPCECARVHYTIKSGNELGIVRVDSETGVLSIEANNGQVTRLELQVEAENGGKSDAATVIISFEGEDGPRKSVYENNDVDGGSSATGRKPLSVDDEANAPHHRSKRQAGLPADVTFLLEKMDAAKTTAMVGDKIEMQVSIWLPTGDMDVRLELYTPYESSAIMMICSPRVTQVGSNFAVVPDTIVAINEDIKGDGRYDRTIMDFGTITNSGADQDTVDANKIYIQFNAIVMEIPSVATSLSAGDIVAVSAGAEYSGRTKVWVGQVSFTYDAAGYVSSTAYAASLGGPATIPKGGVGVFYVDLELYDGASDVIMDAYAPIDDPKVMSICRVSIGNKGDGFSCLNNEHGVLTYSEVTAEGYNSIATFDLDSIVNTAYRSSVTTAPENTVRVEIAAMMLDNPEAVEGTPFQLGSSVEINTQSIYSAQMDVSPAAQALSDSTANLPTFSLKAGHPELTWGQASSIELNMTIPENTLNTYYLEVALPFDTTAVASACEARIKYVGYNFPCFDKTTVTPVYQSEGSDPAEKDYIVMDLGLIANTGQISTTEASTITIVVDFTMAASHATVAAGTDIDFTVGLMYGGSMIWVGLESVPLIATATQPTTPPTFSLTSMLNRREKTILYEKSSHAYYLEMCTEVGTTWPDITVTVTTDLEAVTDRALLEICDISLYVRGQHCAACKDEAYWDFTYTSTAGPAEDQRDGPQTDNYQAVLSMPLFTNAGLGTYWTNKNDSCIGFAIAVHTNDKVTYVNGTEYWTRVTVDYSAAGTWTGEIAAEYQDPPVAGALSAEDDDPDFEITENRLSNNAYLGGIVDYTMNMYLSPRTSLPLNVDAVATDRTLSICRVAVKPVDSKSKNVGCVQDGIKAVYYSDLNDTVFDRGLLDVGHVLDYGQVKRTTDNRADDLFEVHVAAQLHPSGDGTVLEGTTHDLAIAVNVGDTRLWLAEVNATAVIDTAPPDMVEVPTVSLARFNSGGDVVTIGAGAVYEMRVYVPTDSLNDYVFEMFAPFDDPAAGHVSICDVRVVTADWNLPCVYDPHMNHTLIPAADGLSHEAGFLDAGKVANMANEGDLEVQENLMIIEAQIHIPFDSGVADGDALYLTASLTLGDSELWVGRSDFTVQTAILAAEAQGDLDIEFKDGLDTQTSTVGGLTRWFVNIKASTFSTWRTTLRLQMPTDSGTTVLTSLHGHVASWGDNWICPALEDSVYTSQFATSQADVINYKLGATTNGQTTTRYQWTDWKEEDDWLTMGFDLQLAQHQSYRDGTSVTFTVEVVSEDDVAAEKVVPITGTVNIETGAYDEDPDIQYQFTLEDFVCVNKTPGDTITAELHFNHTWNSTAHAYMLEVHVHLPTYLTYQSLDGAAIAPDAITQPDTNEGILILSYTNFYFSSNETVNVTLLIDPAKIDDEHHGCITAHIHTQAIWQEADMAQTWQTLVGAFETELVTEEFQFYVAPCQDPIAVADCQILASSEHPDFPAVDVKPNSPSAWQAQPRGAPFFQKEFVQLNFGNMTKITAMGLLAPSGDTTNHVTEFYLQYSYGGLRFFDYVEKATGNPKLFQVSFPANTWADGDAIFIPMPEGDITARSIRFVPQAELVPAGPIHGARLDFYGCPEETGITEADVCGEDYNGEDVNYNRGFLVTPDSGRFYTCITHNLRWESRCSYTVDLGATWIPIDARITNIDFYHIAEEFLYGITTSGTDTVMRSDDGGDTWASVPAVEYNTAKADTGNVVEIQPLAWDTVRDQTASLGLGSWETLYPQFGELFNTTLKVTFDASSVAMYDGGAWTLCSYWGEGAWNTIIA